MKTTMGRGKLVFKGEESRAKKKKKKNSKHGKRHSEHHHHVGPAVAAEAASALEESSSEAKSKSAAVGAGATKGTTTSPPPPSTSRQRPTVCKGTGTITTSGTVVTGHDTRFTRQLGTGDAILIRTPSGTTGEREEEMRVVTMLLSDTSLNLSSPFSASLASPQPFWFIRKPRDEAREAGVAATKRAESVAELEQRSFGIYGSDTNELVYREKTSNGSYRIQRVKIDQHGGSTDSGPNSALTRGDLLDLRTKKKSDKYC